MLLLGCAQRIVCISSTLCYQVDSQKRLLASQYYSDYFFQPYSVHLNGKMYEIIIMTRTGMDLTVRTSVVDNK